MPDDLANDTEAKRAATEAIVQTLKDNGVDVTVLDDDAEIPDNARKTSVDRSTDEYKKEVSEIAETIDKQLNKTSRPDKYENQSYSATYASLNESPAENGSHRGAGLSSTKVDNKIVSNNRFAPKIAQFISSLNSREDVSANNFVEQFSKETGMPVYGQTSNYTLFKMPGGTIISLRLSDHSAKAWNYGNKKYKADDNYSIVIRVEDSPVIPFKAKSWAKVQEFVYNSLDKARLSDVAKSIYGLVKNGKYVDLANADENNISPKIQKQYVYHGSAHDFDNFDFSHIGEGESGKA